MKQLATILGGLPNRDISPSTSPTSAASVQSTRTGSIQLQLAFWVTSLARGEHKPQPRCIIFWWWWWWGEYLIQKIVVTVTVFLCTDRARMLATHCWLAFAPQPRDFGATEAAQRPASSLIIASLLKSIHQSSKAKGRVNIGPSHTYIHPPLPAHQNPKSRRRAPLHLQPMGHADWILMKWEARTGL